MLCLSSLSVLGWAVLACSSTDGTEPPASGGSGGAVSSTGGAPPAPSGGTTAKAGSGGLAAVGGSAPVTGGVSGSSGAASGGTSGGSASGGANPAATGGQAPSGGGGGATGNAGAAGNPGASGQGGAGGQGGGPAVPTEKFSFFVTSLGAIRELSGSQDGFGGDLRFGEATGLEGADKICRTIAEQSMPGAGQKTWRAFLSTIGGGANGGPVHAIDRVGEGPWYDRLGRIVAMTKADLLNDRPRGASPEIVDDLPNENGVPNHIDGAPDCTGNECPDNHDVLTGTNAKGQLYSTAPGSTCKDWTFKEHVDPATLGDGEINTGTGGGGGGGPGGFSGGPGFPGGFQLAKGPWCGHSWPRTLSGVNWMSSLAEGGCAPGINLDESKGIMGPQMGVYTVGTGGGYGAIYCFALTP
jgi:hypothetical protein